MDKSKTNIPSPRSNHPSYRKSSYLTSKYPIYLYQRTVSIRGVKRPDFRRLGCWCRWVQGGRQARIGRTSWMISSAFYDRRQNGASFHKDQTALTPLRRMRISLRDRGRRVVSGQTISSDMATGRCLFAISPEMTHSRPGPDGDRRADKISNRRSLVGITLEIFEMHPSKRNGWLGRVGRDPYPAGGGL